MNPHPQMILKRPSDQEAMSGIFIGLPTTCSNEFKIIETFRLSFPYVNGVACVIQEADPHPCRLLDRKEAQNYSNMRCGNPSACPQTGIHTYLRATPHQRRFDFAGTLAAD